MAKLENLPEVVSFHLPKEFHRLVHEQCLTSGLECTLKDNAPAESEEPLMKLEGDGKHLRVTQFGKNLFHGLAAREDLETLDLPLQDPFTPEAVRLLRALGLVFSEVLLDQFDGVLRLKKLREAPAGDSELAKIIAKDFEIVQSIKQEFEFNLKRASLGDYPPPPDHKPTVNEAQVAWLKEVQDENNDTRTILRWANRYWTYHVQGPLSPLFIQASTAQDMKTSSERVGRALHQVVLKLAGDEQLRLHILGTRDPITTEAPLLARLDAAVTNVGIQYFEINVGAIGCGQIDLATAVNTSLGYGRSLEVSPSPVFPNLLQELGRLHRERRPEVWPPRIVIPFAPENEAEFSADVQVFVGMFRAAGWNASFCPVASLQYSDGKLSTQEGETIDLVARAYFPGAEGSEVVEAATKDNAVLLVNPAAPHGNKGLFELLDDPTIPWTRVFGAHTSTGPDGKDIQLMEFARTNQKKLVLKPSAGYGGRNVLLGWTMEESSWVEALEKAIHDYPQGARSILQLGRSIPKATFIDHHNQAREMYWDLNCFLVGGKFGGLLSRASHAAVTNVTQGGGFVPVYVL